MIKEEIENVAEQEDEKVTEQEVELEEIVSVSCGTCDVN